MQSIVYPNENFRANAQEFLILAAFLFICLSFVFHSSFIACSKSAFSPLVIGYASAFFSEESGP